MVLLREASGVVDDSGAVGLPGRCAPVDADSDGLLSDSDLHINRTVRLDVGVVGDGNCGVAFSVVFACPVCVRISIVLLEDGIFVVIFGPLETGIVVASRAFAAARRPIHGIVAVVGDVKHTIYPHLLREREQLGGSNCMGPLEDGRGGESPAAAAAALVLYPSHCALVPPVNRVRQRLNVDGR